MLKHLLANIYVLTCTPIHTIIYTYVHSLLYTDSLLRLDYSLLVYTQYALLPTRMWLLFTALVHKRCISICCNSIVWATSASVKVVICQLWHAQLNYLIITTLGVSRQVMQGGLMDATFTARNDPRSTPCNFHALWRVFARC